MNKAKKVFLVALVGVLALTTFGCGKDKTTKAKTNSTTRATNQTTKIAVTTRTNPTTKITTTEKAKLTPEIKDISFEKEFVYDGNAITDPTYTYTGDGNVKIYYKQKDALYSTYSLTKPVDAGNYIVKVEASETDNYKCVSSTLEFEIKKADQVAPTLENLSITTIYNENYTLETLSSMLESLNENLTWVDDTQVIGLGGTFKAYYNIDSKNYNNLEYDITVNVNNANTSVVSIFKKAANLKYNGEPQQLLENAGSVIGGVYEFSFDGVNYTTDITELVGTLPGEYTFWFRIKPNDGYNGTTAITDKVTIGKGTASLSISDPSKVYDGNQIDDLVISYVGDGRLNYIQYRRIGDFVTSVKPTDAGEYEVTVSYYTGENYNGISQTINFTISKADSEYVYIPENVNYKYDGLPHELVKPGISNTGTVVYSLDNENFSEDIPTAVNAGEKIIYYKIIGDENHKDSEVQSIEAMGFRKESIIALSSDCSKKYDGTPIAAPTYTYTGDGEIEIYYKQRGADDSEYTKDAPSKIGLYTVKLTVENTINYFGTTAISDFEISNLEVPELEITNIDALNKKFDGTNTAAAYSTNSDGEVTISYKMALADDEYFDDTNIPKYTGDYIVRIEVAATDTYMKRTVYALYTITKGDPVEKEHSIVYVDYSDEFSLDDVTLDEDFYFVDDRFIVDGNFIYADAYYQTIDDYEPYYFKLKIYINLKEVTLTPPTAKEGLVYINSSTKQELVEGGSVENGTLYYSLDNETWSTAIPKEKNPGTYTVYYKVIGDQFYADVDVQSIQVEIAKLENSLISEPVLKDEYVYSGAAQNVFTLNMNTGKYVGEPTFTHVNSIYYKLDDGSWLTTVSLLKVTNAGTHTLYYYTAEDTYYKGCGSASEPLSVEFTVLKATPTLTITAKENLYYTGEGQSLLDSVTWKLGKTTYTSNLLFSLDDETYTSDISEIIGINARSYTVYIKLASNDNTNEVKESVDVVINKGINNVTLPDDKNLVYNEMPQELIDPVLTTFGSVEYSIDNESWSNDIPEKTNAGTYIVYYKVEETNNYSGVSGQIEVKIDKAQVE